MDSERVSAGIDGLDTILDGGLLADRAYMIRGDPGTGKTLLGLQFLSEGVDRGETSLCVNFEERTGEIERNAANVGIDVEGVEFLDLTPDGEVFAEQERYDLFEPDEVESDSIIESITAAVDEYDPDRVFVDPVSRLRMLTPDDHQFRKEVSAFITYLTDRGSTVLFSTQPTADRPDDDLQFVCDGTISLDTSSKGRVVEVKKLRGSEFMTGKHSLRIDQGGHRVYPKIVPRQHQKSFAREELSSGIEGLDSLLYGGIAKGTVTVISGPSGVGKTTTGTHFIKEAAARGERSVAYLFEETADTFTHRSEALNIPVSEMEEEESLSIQEIEPLEMSPDEFAHRVRTEVERKDAGVVMIDGISGYRLSVRGEEEDLVRELHALCRYLKNMGVTVILVDDVASVTGEFTVTSDRISYLGDNILFLRYLELEGELRKAVGVLKKRTSDFERNLREFEITDYGVTIGEPMTGLRGVLSGSPEFTKGDGRAD